MMPLAALLFMSSGDDLYGTRALSCEVDGYKVRIAAVAVAKPGVDDRKWTTAQLRIEKNSSKELRDAGGSPRKWGQSADFN
mmetsp:Transcript_28267/g.70875  ORF Transcript_28267/g.70875 Transcript_28267/m.70875 type:complete len:81 (+) Transcript_28267:213-455(+)